MAEAALVESKISAGKTLLEALDRSGFPVTAAFWLYSSEEEMWRLMIASPVVRERGARYAFQLVYRVYFSVRGIDLSPTEILLLKDTDTLVQLLRSVVATGQDAIANIRFTRNSIGGVFIEDALIYRAA